MDLYGLPLERFVPERNALAKRLRASGDREQAAAVAALRKPSVAAWAVNQLLRTQRDAIAELFEAGDELRKANERLLGGEGDARALRRALAREREAVNALSEKARGVLDSGAPAILERVSETLHAAALDPEARAKAADGSLERELRHVGLGAGDVRPPAKARAKPAASKQLGAARKHEADARRATERAARDLSAAHARRERAAEGLRQAEQALAAAGERAEQATVAHRQALDALEAIQNA